METTFSPISTRGIAGGGGGGGGIAARARSTLASSLAAEVATLPLATGADVVFVSLSLALSSSSFLLSLRGLGRGGGFSFGCWTPPRKAGSHDGGRRQKRTTDATMRDIPRRPISRWFRGRPDEFVPCKAPLPRHRNSRIWRKRVDSVLFAKSGGTICQA